MSIESLWNREEQEARAKIVKFKDLRKKALGELTQASQALTERAFPEVHWVRQRSVCDGLTSFSSFEADDHSMYAEYVRAAERYLQPLSEARARERAAVFEAKCVRLGSLASHIIEKRMSPQLQFLAVTVEELLELADITSEQEAAANADERKAFTRRWSREQFHDPNVALRFHADEIEELRWWVNDDLERCDNLWWNAS